MTKCKFYSKNSKEMGICINSNCVLNHCYFSDCFNECECFEPEQIEYGGSDVYEDEMRGGCLTYNREFLNKEPIVWKGEPTTDNDFMTPEQLKTIMLPDYTARIIIGSWEINLTNKTFTEEQIKNMKEMLGWEVENL